MSILSSTLTHALNSCHYASSSIVPGRFFCCLVAVERESEGAGSQQRLRSAKQREITLGQPIVAVRIGRESELVCCSGKECGCLTIGHRSGIKLGGCYRTTTCTRYLIERDIELELEL